MWELLAVPGFDFQNLVAGLAGGMCAAFANEHDHPWPLIKSIVVGGLVGGYLGDVANPFGLGVVAMPLCRLWFISVERKIP